MASPLTLSMVLERIRTCQLGLRETGEKEDRKRVRSSRNGAIRPSGNVKWDIQHFRQWTNKCDLGNFSGPLRDVEAENRSVLAGTLLVAAHGTPEQYLG